MNQIKHFFVNPLFAAGWFQVNGLGVQEWMMPGMVNRPMGTNEYLFMLFHEGSNILIEGEMRACPPGTFFFWPPNHAHLFGNAGRRWCHSWICVDGRLVRRLFARTQLMPLRPFFLPDPSLMDDHLVAIYRELSYSSQPDEAIARNLLENMLRGIDRSVRAGEVAAGIPPHFMKVKQHIEDNFRKKLTLGTLARMAGLSVSRFCSEFKRHLGRSAIDYAVQLRMSEAVYLLRDKNLRIQEIAERSGYRDLFYFSKHFKMRFGASPSVMRKRLGEKKGTGVRPYWPSDRTQASGK